MAEALRRVRIDLGSDAVILSWREAESGAGVEVVASTPTEVASQAPGHRGNGHQIESLRREVCELKGLITTHLLGRIGDAGKTPAQRAYQYLKRQELDPLIMGRVLTPLVNAPEEGFTEALIANLSNEIKVADPLGLSPDSDRAARVPGGGPVICFLIGPTGTGKTTTIAKLAAVAALKHHQRRRVALLTVDTYRIGASEQLKVYGRIMGLPVAVVESPGEMSQAVEALSNWEMVLVDTAGRAPRDKDSLDELAGLIQRAPGAQVLLCLSATAKAEDMSEVADRYLSLPLSGLIFTKIDESKSYGGLVNQVSRLGLPVTHLTCGQRVPEDIYDATPLRVVRLILRWWGR